MNSTVKMWLGKSREELDAIYRNAEPGNIPEGDTRGTAILAGSVFAKIVAFLAGVFAWQGKIFDLFSSDRQAGVLVNKITPFSLTFIVAKVYRDKSWLDGKDTIVIDYSKTSFFARVIRDEIREVEPGVYLGKVWWGKKRILDFALTQAVH
ncbi:hypothetical protein FCL47_14345 [Desulfopila sp. IMCC35006]|uniref:hypothetical protein n=1 Tax=Desulfopila sp. IMCC35006 TaxID=2569542 RepID=UPI0010AD48C1|nr:hypothetical protein [Desulfopila sp. IMCC35006]TKB25237.1 hypothetical protein FCL47_14345 [Desulfopila sp. IMCC35006]